LLRVVSKKFKLQEIHVKNGVLSYLPPETEINLGGKRYFLSYRYNFPEKSDIFRSQASGH
jgi:hypothetical protein